LDNQQDLHVIQTNITNQNVYVTFERFSTTGDVNDLSFVSNVYLIFSMGSYTNNFNPENAFFRKSLETDVNLINCISRKENLRLY
jgi:hypothetical protein